MAPETVCASSRSAPARTASCATTWTTAWCSPRSRTTTAGRRKNSGVVLKVIPDDTMRGLELPHRGSRRRGQRHAARHRPPAGARLDGSTSSGRPGLDFSYLAFNMRDPGARGQARAPRDRLRDQPRGDRRLPAPRSGPRGDRARAAAWPGRTSRTCTSSPTTPSAPQRLLDEAGYRDPDGAGPLPRLRLSLKISTNEETRLQSTDHPAGSAAGRHRPRRSSRTSSPRSSPTW